jgi:hypothetical protein
MIKERSYKKTMVDQMGGRSIERVFLFSGALKIYANLGKEELDDS